jgi:general stress protein YciG
MYSKKFFQEAGRKGGKKTKAKYGKDHYSKIGSTKRKKSLSTDEPQTP